MRNKEEREALPGSTKLHQGSSILPAAAQTDGAKTCSEGARKALTRLIFESKKAASGV